MSDRFDFTKWVKDNHESDKREYDCGVIFTSPIAVIRIQWDCLVICDRNTFRGAIPETAEEAYVLFKLLGLIE